MRSPADYVQHVLDTRNTTYRHGQGNKPDNLVPGSMFYEYNAPAVSDDELHGMPETVKHEMPACEIRGR